MSDTTVENVVRKRLSDSSEQVRIGSTSITYNSMGNVSIYTEGGLLFFV